MPHCTHDARVVACAPPPAHTHLAKILIVAKVALITILASVLMQAISFIFALTDKKELKGKRGVI